MFSIQQKWISTQPQSLLSCTCRCAHSLFGSILASPCKICRKLRATGQRTSVFSCQYHSPTLSINLHLNSTVISTSRQSLEIFKQINAVSDMRGFWTENYIHTVLSVLKFNIILSSMHSSSEWHLSLRFSTKALYTFLLFHVHVKWPIPNYHQFYHPNDTVPLCQKGWCNLWWHATIQNRMPFTGHVFQLYSQICYYMCFALNWL
jgi:hypothetical protein